MNESFPGRPGRHPVVVGIAAVVALALLYAAWPQRLEWAAAVMRKTVGRLAVVAAVSVARAAYGLVERIAVWVRQRNQGNTLAIAVWVLYAVPPAATATIAVVASRSIAL